MASTIGIHGTNGGDDSDSDPMDTPSALAMLDCWLRDEVHPNNCLYKQVSLLECTAEDAKAAITFAEAFVNDDARRTFWMAQVVLCHVALSMQKYGDTGFGDKPPELNRVTYWAQHICTTTLEEAVVEVHHLPIDELVVFESTKPPSSAPKCKFCKAKIGRGTLALRVSRVEFHCNTLFKMKPTLKCTTYSIVCPSCVTDHCPSDYIRSEKQLNTLPVQCDISLANRDAADALAAQTLMAANAAADARLTKRARVE